jgi:hypothetical protein
MADLATPEMLTEVPGYHEGRLEGIRAGSSFTLAGIIERSFDPQTGELGTYLAEVRDDVGLVLEDTHSQVTEALRNTREIVKGLASGEQGEAFEQALSALMLSQSARILGSEHESEEIAALRAGLDIRVYEEALAAVTLGSGLREINQYGSDIPRQAMHHAYDRRTFREATEAVTLGSAVRTIAEIGSPEGQGAMRRGLDARVQSEAQSAVTLGSGLRVIRESSSNEAIAGSMRTVFDERIRAEARKAVTASSALRSARDYSTEAQRGEIEHEIAVQWIPREQASLEKAQSRIEELEEKLKEIDEAPLWKRIFTSKKKQEVQSELEHNQLMESFYQNSLDELWKIMDPDKEA